LIWQNPLRLTPAQAVLNGDPYKTWIMHTISVPSAGSARLMLAVVE
jgi:hypothetical protein